MLQCKDVVHEDHHEPAQPRTADENEIRTPLLSAAQTSIIPEGLCRQPKSYDGTYQVFTIIHDYRITKWCQVRKPTMHALT